MQETSTNFESPSSRRCSALPAGVGAPLRGANSVEKLASKEIADNRCDLGTPAFEGEMTGVQEVHFRVRVVPPEGLGARWQKERIVLPPHGQRRRPLSADVVLEFGIERDIALVVAK